MLIPFWARNHLQRLIIAAHGGGSKPGPLVRAVMALLLNR